MRRRGVREAFAVALAVTSFVTVTSWKTEPPLLVCLQSITLALGFLTVAISAGR